MKKDGRVVELKDGRVMVAVAGNANGDQKLAPCCVVPSVVEAATNPRGWDVRPGDLVTLSDGLGLTMTGAGSFLLLPGILLGITLTWLVPAVGWGHTLGEIGAGAASVVLGVVLAVLFFRSLRLERFPVVVKWTSVPDEGNCCEDEET